MILIIGSTGNLGSSIPHHLVKKGARDQFLATLCNAKGLQAILANFTYATSLNKLFKGIDKLL